MRKLLLPLMLSASVFAATPAQAHSFPDQASHDARGALGIAVFGDSPYGTKDADTAQFDATPAFIKTINDDRDVSLVLNVGDIHSGKQTCSQAYDQSIYDLWTAFQSPVVYTPGDNEWTDCHKSKEGGLDPLANLGYVRDIFFATPGNAIAVDKPLLSQAQAYDANYPTDAEYVENVMWQDNDVVFVTVNMPGGSNNDASPWTGTFANPAAQAQEAAERTAADTRWLQTAFKAAKTTHARAVVVITQADMWDPEAAAPGGAAFGGAGWFWGHHPHQLLVQFLAALTIIVWDGVITFLIWMIIKYVFRMKLRFSDEELQIGDVAVHGEEAYPQEEALSSRLSVTAEAEASPTTEEPVSAKE